MPKRVSAGLLGASAGLIALICVLSAGGAGAAVPQKHYLRLGVYASFALGLDYGSNPRAVYNGVYQKLILYNVRAIVVFDGSRVYLPPASMVVQGNVRVGDERTQWVSSTSRKPVKCAARGVEVKSGERIWHSGTGTGEEPVFEFTKQGRVAVSAEGLTVDPGAAVPKNVGCAATEELENHGLPGGPWFSVSAPPKSLFSGTKPFSINCTDSYKHGFTKETDGNGHAFDGFVEAAVTFTPFPASNLAQVKQKLRDSVGQKGVYGGSTNPKDWKDCLQ